MVIESATNAQNSLTIEIFEPNDLKALITFSILKQCQTFFRGRNLSNL